MEIDMNKDALLDEFATVEVLRKQEDSKCLQSARRIIINQLKDIGVGVVEAKQATVWQRNNWEIPCNAS